jgi:hypothetical protein
MKRFLLLASLLLGAAGCVSIVPMVHTDPVDPSEALFVQVLEAPVHQRAADAMAQLESDYPQSPWTSRARTVDDLLKSRDALQRRIRDLERKSSDQAQKNRTLEGEVERLLGDLEKLKQIIIEMEKRSTI